MKMQPKARRATRDDAKRCSEFLPARSAEDLAGLIDQPDVEWIVLEDEAGWVVGTSIIHHWPWNKVVWLWELAVDPARRRRGYGTTLLEATVEAAREMGAVVLMDWASSTAPGPFVHMMLRNGFRICGTNDRWLPAEKDTTAVFYARDL